jgi:hypothetical protein
VSAFISEPVVVDGSLVISPGDQLKGTLEQITILGATAIARVSFSMLVIGNRSVPLHSRPAMVIAPARSDMDIINAALGTLLASSISAAIGASSADGRIFERALLEGARASSPAALQVPVSVILSSDLEI